MAEEATDKYVRAILDKRIRQSSTGPKRLKAVQVQDADTEADGQRVIRTLQRGDACLVSGEEDLPHLGVVLQAYLVGKHAKLRVAWLYRQHEVDAKALPTECHPREVFFSEHTDEIDAATVQHPCTIRFMPAKTLARTGPPTVAHGQGRQLFKRPRPGFLCCRVWDTDKQKLLPLPIASTSVNHKLAEQTQWLTQLTTDKLRELDGQPKSKTRRGSPK